MLTPAARTTANAARLALAGTAVLALAGCSRPDWTNPETSKGSRALPPPTAKKALPIDAKPAPPVPAWALPLMGQQLHTAFPKDGVCMGNTDGVIRVHRGQPPGAIVVGWGWEYATKAPVPRVVIADASGVIVGAGQAGENRPDVPRAVPAITSLETGWRAVAYALAGRLQAYGIVDKGQAVCPLAGAEL